MLSYYLQMIESEGDKQKFERLYDQYNDLMFYIAKRFFTEQQDLEDVVQDVFMTLQEKQGELTPDNLRAWLYSVAQKKLLEEKRDEIRRSRLVRYDDEEAEDPTPLLELAEEPVSDVDTLRRRLMQSLTPEEQALFAAIYEQQHTRKETARQLGVSENALNVRVYRLKKRIRTLAKTILNGMLFLCMHCR